MSIFSWHIVGYHQYCVEIAIDDSKNDKLTNRVHRLFMKINQVRSSTNLTHFDWETSLLNVSIVPNLYRKWRYFSGVMTLFIHLYTSMIVIVCMYFEKFYFAGRLIKYILRDPNTVRSGKCSSTTTGTNDFNLAQFKICVVKRVHFFFFSNASAR